MTPPRSLMPLVGPALALLLGSCGNRAPGPRWIELARGFEPRPLTELVERWERADGDTGNRARPVTAGIGLEHTLARPDWSLDPATGDWLAPLPRGAFRYGSEGFTRLSAPDRKFKRSDFVSRFRFKPFEDELAEDEFVCEGERIRLHLASGEVPPAEATLSQRLENGHEVEGSWEARVGGFRGLAIPVFSGEREELRCDLPPGSQLSFLAVHHARTREKTCRLRVLLDGQEIFEHEFADPELALQGSRHTVTLPTEGRRRALLAFEAEGSPGIGLFFQPVIGPAAIGTYGARPWPDARPDIVLFLADTFRADNLACYGGDPELAPNLNALAERSCRFRRARSPAAWTLPSISSLLSGLFPGQHGTTETGDKFPLELETLPESLRRAGYRTGAITDASFFSAAWDMNQGFEWFSEHFFPDWYLERTIDEALDFLEHDDGRPTFLLVHTYRTHAPYRVGAQEDSSAYDALIEEGHVSLLQAGPLTAATVLEPMLRNQDRFRELYREGVRGFDQGSARLLAALEHLGFPERGYLLFTSDHGEALGENEDMQHGRHLWEVKLRIPLLVTGPDVAPRDVDWMASLVDLAPTLAGIAGLQADPRWAGVSLLTLASERPAFAFQLEKKKRQVAIIDGGHKIITSRPPETLSAGECEEAYDLGSDPGEEHNLVNEAPWPAELARRRSGEALELLQARVKRVQVEVAPEVLEQLREIGYGGEE